MIFARRQCSSTRDKESEMEGINSFDSRKWKLIELERIINNRIERHEKEKHGKEPPLGEVEIDNGETHFALVSDAYYAKTPHRILKLLRPGITEGEACALADYHFNKENSNE